MLVLVKTCLKRVDDVFKVTIFRVPRHLQDILEDGKLLCFIVTKTDHRFVISLDFGYV